MGEVGFAGPKRDVLRNYRQLTFARGWIWIPELTRYTKEYAGYIQVKKSVEDWQTLSAF